MTMCWELETRFQVVSEKPFDYIEEQVTRQLGVELRSRGLCVDRYYGFTQPSDWRRLRSYNGIQPYHQRKVVLPAPENNYGIEIALEIPLSGDSQKFPSNQDCLDVRGHRTTYQITVGNNVLNIPFDRMIRPRGNFVEVEIEGTEMPLKHDRLKQLTGELSEFIDIRFLPLFKNLAELHCRPIYPLQILRPTKV